MEFNSEPSKIMHIDFNSCFATIEQQANPFLRGKALVVAAYDSPRGCILAPSIEAKKYGVKTGMRVSDGKLLCPSLIVMTSDPDKYRFVHLKLRKIISSYTLNFSAKSIDEFVLSFKSISSHRSQDGMYEIGKEIKQRIRDEIGEWMSVSIGIATNRFLAKTAASLHKPDGLDEINKSNFLQIYEKLALTDLCGIKKRNTLRLSTMNIFTVREFYEAPIWKLKAAFLGISGYYWHQRLRGLEIDNIEFGRRTFGNSYSLPKPLLPEETKAILMKLIEKTAFRLRRGGFKTKGVHLALIFRDRRFWHKGISINHSLFDSREIYKELEKVLDSCPINTPVGNLAISCFNLVSDKTSQLEFFTDIPKLENLSVALDSIKNRWGGFAITSARMHNTGKFAPDRIAFGGVREL